MPKHCLLYEGFVKRCGDHKVLMHGAQFVRIKVGFVNGRSGDGGLLYKRQWRILRQAYTWYRAATTKIVEITSFSYSKRKLVNIFFR
jgi:hypothetical protein